MSWVNTFKKKTGKSEDEGSLEKLFTGFVLYCMLVSLVILVVGVIGNATICYIIVRVRSMRSSVNYYLFSLALADILNSVTWIIFAVVWYFELLSSEIREAIWNIHDVITSVNSNLTLTALTINRYIAICSPLKARYVTTHSRTIKVISAIWIFTFYYYTAYHLLKLMLCGSKDNAFCHAVRFIFSDIMYAVLFLAVPMFTITVSYTLIGLTIWSSSQLSDSCSFQNCSDRRTSAKRGLTLSIAAILEFLVCSIPCQLVQISALVFPEFLTTSSGHALFFFTKTLNLLSTVVDPIIYSLVSTKFRKAFQDLFNPSGRGTSSTKRTESTHLDFSASGIP